MKGWSRKKKEAINRNWDKLKELSFCKNESHSDNFEQDKDFDSAQPDSENKK